MKKNQLEMTPLQRIVGFDVAEEIYDNLPIFAQYILDLKIEGWTEQDIALALGCAQSTVNDTFRRARHYLLTSKLKLILETRVHYRETHYTAVDVDVHGESKGAIGMNYGIHD